MTDLDKLAPALVALQAVLPPVARTGENPHFKSKFVPLPEIMRTIQPLLAKHKLAVSQFVTHVNGQSAMRTILLHESGQFLEDTGPLLLAKNDPQSQGSAITYARRYGLMAVLGLVGDEDDDGTAATLAKTVDEAVKAAKLSVWNAAKSIGMDVEAMKADFSQYSGGQNLEAADLDALRMYLDNLQGRKSA